LLRRVRRVQRLERITRPVSGIRSADGVWVNRILHETSHSCGTLNLQNGANYDSYRVGEWFEAEYQAQNGLNTNCQPRTTVSSDPDTGANQ